MSENDQAKPTATLSFKLEKYDSKTGELLDTIEEKEELDSDDPLTMIAMKEIEGGSKN